MDLKGIRFAPSPTGRFHIGNLRTAWISAAWARELREPLVIRFEDIDTPRVVMGAREAQVSDLAALGMIPDRIYLQSDRRERHFALFTRAISEEVLYPCTCSRKEVRDALFGLASAPHGELSIYTGHCRRSENIGAVGPGGVAWRFRDVDDSGGKDFIVARTDEISFEETSFVPAYHWACAIDDFDGRYRLLVRAWDLATSTPCQREIQDWISRSEGIAREKSAVFHTALVVDNEGHRLEKRARGVTLAELLEKGWTAERILARFTASFRHDFSELRPERIFGEEAREKMLANLGF